MRIFCFAMRYAYFSRMDKKKKTGLSESVVVGVIAMVFLIVGYQTAVFVYRASVMKIVSNRDVPDTVYVCSETLQAFSEAVEPGQMPSAPVKTYRKNASHSEMAEEVRRASPRTKVESFRFDPNTVSVDDLCRLGFSQKQAQSIENYRHKGGRFRRKEDFSRSFVVSDSIYRRLESYIDIPLLDLNLADSAAFDALPGIGGWFARRIIEHRAALGGFSYKEQLMDIHRFTEDKYHALEDLVTVSPEHITPYPLWSLPADSLKHHPYISDYQTARSIVLFRDNSPPSSWTAASLAEAGIISRSMAEKLARCVISSE